MKYLQYTISLLTALFLLTSFTFAEEFSLKENPRNGKTLLANKRPIYSFIKITKNNGRGYRKIRANKDPLLVSDSFIEEFITGSDDFNIEDISKELTPTSLDKKMGKTFIRYNQKIDGIPVIGAELTVELDRFNYPENLYGRVLENKEVNTTPVISDRIALRAAYYKMRRNPELVKIIREMRTKLHDMCVIKLGRVSWRERYICYREVFREVRKRLRVERINTPQLLIYNKSFINNLGKGSSKLIWQFKLAVDEGKVIVEYLVDASTGKIINTESKSSGSLPTRFILDCSVPGSEECYYDFSFAGFIYGRSEGSPVRGQNPHNGTHDVDNAYDMMHQIHNYYLNSLGRNGGNDRGGIGNNDNAAYDTQVVYTHLENQTFFGSACSHNAGGLATDWYMGLCTGSVVPDFVGHEHAHFVTKYMGYNLDDTPRKLLAESESGAIAEGYSDLMGEVAEKDISGTNDWKIGTGTIQFFRDMADPKSLVNVSSATDSFPEKYTDPDYFCGGHDSMGVHTNSSVINKAMYLMAEGGTFNDCEMTGIGIDKVAKLWTAAITTNFGTTETFNLAYHHINMTCDLMNKSEYTNDDCTQVRIAMEAVEMDKAGGCVCLEEAGYPGDGENECEDYAHHPNVGSSEPATCVEVTPIPGDYDRNGIVDQADKLIWNSTYGATVEPGTGADGNGDGKVDAADYSVWRDNLTAEQ